MRRLIHHPFGTALLVGLLGLPAPLAAGDGIDFNRDIRPILSDTCFPCHGPDNETREADLRFDREDSVKIDRGGYSVVVPGDVKASELIRRITSGDEYEKMPPPDSGMSLSPGQIELLSRWVASGAAWSQHWAYVKPVRHEPPPVKDETWPLNWVDRFILARIEQAGIAPAPQADRVTLIRRLSFDLTGLPPTPAEVDRFVRDDAPDAYARLVERLLSSDAHAERLAVYWLDLVRYADTVGYHGDQDHHISPYRDYVIDAFAANVPFDRFTREQLAGDLLPNPTIDQKVATGYNRLLQTSHEGGVQPKEYLAIYAADRMRNLSAVWMGGTLGCAQCHDHKFDPYTAKDFYAVSAFFADVDEAQHFKSGRDTVPTPRPPEIEVLSKRERAAVDQWERRIAELQKALDGCDDPAERAGVEQEITAAKAERDAIQQGARKTMVTVAIEPRTVRILPRGNWLDESGPVVEPAIPEFLGKLDTDGRATRLDLANWLVDAEDGAGLLTARVQVNRLWYLFFGEGLSPSLDDFGGQGEPPTHPQLLDRLAHEFIESGWDVRHMVRLIVTSAAYRQESGERKAESGRPDPDSELPLSAFRSPLSETLFARQSRWRLPAEFIRDNALAVSGLLVREVGGASVKPYQPDGYYRHLNFPKRTYQQHDDERQWRRGLYVHWQRQYLHPMLKAFDAPSREECTARRPRSNTPLASLVLLNDPTFIEAARKFAERILTEGGQSDAERLDYAFKLAVSRTPDDYERGLLMDLLASARESFTTESAGRLTDIGLAKTADGMNPQELAAWTTIGRAILNLNETNTRN
jgi:hypothetical protein